MRKSHSFSARLTFAILLNTTILFIVAIAVVSYFAHKLIVDEAKRNATSLLESTKLDIEKTLGEVEIATQSLQWVIQENNKDTAAMYHFTRELVESNPNVVGSAVAFRSGYFPQTHFFSPYSYRDEQSGQIFSKQLGNSQYDYFQMEWYKNPVQTGKPHWSEPYFDEGGGNQMMTTYSLPLKDKTGAVYAILTADINLKWLTERISSTRPYKNAYTILLGRQGRYLSHPDRNLILGSDIFTLAQKTDNAALDELGRKMVSRESGLYKLSVDGNDVFAVYGPVSDGWSAALFCPYKDVFAPLLRMHVIILLVGLLGLILVSLLCVRTIRRLTQPVTEFSEAAMNIANGDFNTKLPDIKTQDEMMQLHDSFEHMQQSLVDYIAELKDTTATKERYESELTIARNIQMGMVPHEFPERSDCRIYASLLPAREVGGDLYDFVIQDDQLFFTIGDVLGKGVPAALFMSITRSAFRFLVSRKLPLDAMVRRINDAISEGNDRDMFVTLFVGRLDLKTGEFEYCNAGHNPIVLMTPDGQGDFLRAKPNVAVGVMGGFDYEAEHLTLVSGSRLLLYTDGVTEAENVNMELFGNDRLLHFVKGIQKEDTPESIANHLYEEVKTFAGEAQQNDDIAILTIEINSLSEK